MRKDKKSFIEGFTIIELLISVSIIAVLASMILALNGTIRNKAEQAACVANMRSLFTALSAYNNDMVISLRLQTVKMRKAFGISGSLPLKMNMIFRGRHGFVLLTVD